MIYTNIIFQFIKFVFFIFFIYIICYINSNNKKDFFTICTIIIILMRNIKFLFLFVIKRVKHSYIFDKFAIFIVNVDLL